MFLIIDRCHNDINYYTFSYLIDNDILLIKQQWDKMDITKELDKLITNSIDKGFVIRNMNNPLLDLTLYDSTTSPTGSGIKFNWTKRSLRQYWKLRIKYAHRPIELIEFGKRLF